MTTRRTLYFTASKQVELREEPVPVPASDQALVETLLSAISSGTEMLVYRGQFPKDLSDTHDAFSSELRYPLAYGYACVGRVTQTGKAVDRKWIDQLVFAFQPHTSHFIADPATLIPLPSDLSPEAAAFLPNMETAVNLVQDGAPILGERALVFGQGIIGLLTTALLKRFPLEGLITVDRFDRRRKASLDLGVTAALDPDAPDFENQARALIPAGADLTFELSGAPDALNPAIALTTFSGRILIGSWYGEKRAPLDLGGRFHRSRIKLIASQVSTISPELSGRWDKPRRFAVAWNMLREIQPQKWITHRFNIEQAAEAYALLDRQPQDTIQILLTYPS
jgi:2-desacetyl-2-hydroxyethyl bacteriochlorophyllide A dehydrogenase